MRPEQSWAEWEQAQNCRFKSELAQPAGQQRMYDQNHAVPASCAIVPDYSTVRNSPICHRFAHLWMRLPPVVHRLPRLVPLQVIALIIAPVQASSLRSPFSKEGRFWKLGLRKRAVDDNVLLCLWEKSLTSTLISESKRFPYTNAPIQTYYRRVSTIFKSKICNCVDFKELPGFTEFRKLKFWYWTVYRCEFSEVFSFFPVFWVSNTKLKIGNN